MPGFLDRVVSGFKGDCPLCGRHAQVYDRRLRGTLVADLTTLYKLDKRHPGKWFHASDFVSWAGRDYNIMRWWELIESSEESALPTTQSKGLWRITLAGKAFVEGNMVVASNRLDLFGECIGVSPKSKLINIREALGTKFNLEELMR